MNNKEKLENLEAKLEKLQTKLHEKNLNFDFKASESFDDWIEYQEPELSQINKLDQEIRLLEIPEFQDLPDYGDVMNLKDFIECVKDGGFIDYDGYGNYIKDGKMSDITINPSDIQSGSIRDDFDTIIWFNR